MTLSQRLFLARRPAGRPRQRRPQAVPLWPRRSWRRRLIGAGLGGLLVIVVLGAALVGILVGVSPAHARTSYVEAITDEPPLLNPVLAPYTLASQDVLPLVFTGLVRADAKGNLTPDLAASWDVSDDARSYRFHLRDGLTWHDGQPITAYDVAFTIGLVQAPDHQGSQELADLWRGITVVADDDRTITFTLPEPLASFPEHLTLGLLPRHVLHDVSAAELPRHPFNRQPIGSGPYRVEAIDLDRITLTRHRGYHGVAPRLERIELRYFAERAVAVEALLAGEVDGLGAIRPEEADRIGSAPGIAVYTIPERAKVALLSLNVQTPLLRERAVRLAIGRAIDRDSLVRRALSGQAEPAFGPIPVQSWAYARPPGAGVYEPAAAAELLAEAGWLPGPDGVRERDGQTLRFTLLTADTAERVAAAREIGRQLRLVGFDVTVHALPADELAEEYLEPRRFDAALVGQWTMGSDPDVYPQWHSSQAGRLGGNFAGFSDPDVDRWLEVGRQQEQPAERRNAYLHFQARWAEEQPSVVLYHPLYSFAVRSDIWGVRADPAPDSSWRLRDATSWYRPVRPTFAQNIRAAVAARMPWLSGS